MAGVIGTLYEIQEQIGSGGGGVVYLGQHLRLNKRIVLKADRRTLSVGKEALRREVDLLKGLSHTYIPQVYDFIEEGGVVYTVMDYIDGESLDKILQRGWKPSQPQVLCWACQLLEALCYLHSRPPYGILHGDIKPANIMLRPEGDICLIDFNIALALGEDGAVKVGSSRGYASPEHYGIEFGEGVRKSSDLMAGPDSEMTETADSGSTSGHRAVRLDIRSDIYSLGATLYHLLSGNRPAQDAQKVKMLETETCSRAVAEIIKKAMEPDPKRRYQSAQEMLEAIRQLYKNDIRTRRHRRRMAWSAVFTICMFLVGGMCTFIGLKKLENHQASLALAEYASKSLDEGNVLDAIRQALLAIPREGNLFSAPVAPQARKALTDALGVYELADGFRTEDTIKLSSAPFQTGMSSDGTYFAVSCSGNILIFESESGQKRAELKTVNSAMAELAFPKDHVVVYAGDQGISAYDLEAETLMWTGKEATAIAVSDDGSTVAAVNRDAGQAVLYRVEDGKEIAVRDFDGHHMSVVHNDIFANPGDNVLALNHDGTLLAVSFSDGGFFIYDLKNLDGDMVIYEQSEFTCFEGGFCGRYFAFAAGKGGQSLFGVIDTAETVYAGEYESKSPFHVKADEKGIYLSNDNLLVRFDPDTLEETELAYTDEAAIIEFSVSDNYVLVATEDNGYRFFDRGAKLMTEEFGTENWDFVNLAGNHAIAANRNAPYVRWIKLESHDEANYFSYDARYPHDEARICEGGDRVMLFDYQGFQIYDGNGIVVADETLPRPEEIYDQQFEREAGKSWLKVIWYDGAVCRYDGETGTLLSETKEDPPDESLLETFTTSRYRIESSLHGAPRVYELESGKFVGELEQDSYLTYVTETEGYLVTEYVSASGERYGLLLDQELQILARMPDLCDIYEGMAIFDDQSGNLRQCRLYSLQELITLGETYIKESERRSK